MALTISNLTKRVRKKLNEGKSPHYFDGEYKCFDCGWGGYPMLTYILKLARQEERKMKNGKR